jgi:hypothetical protein
MKEPHLSLEGTVPRETGWPDTASSSHACHCPGVNMVLSIKRMSPWRKERGRLWASGPDRRDDDDTEFASTMRSNRHRT